MARLRELCSQGLIADHRSFRREEESAWWTAVDSIVLYYLGPDHEEYLALCSAPDVQTFGGPESRLDVPVPLGDIGQRTGLHIVLARAIGTDLAQSDHVVSHVSENVALTVKGRDWAEELEDPTPTQVERPEQVLAAFLAFVEGVS